MPGWPTSTTSAVNRWIVPRAVMCSLFWTGVLLVFTGMILLVTSKHKGAMYESWGAVLLGLGLCFLLVCLILCVHAYRVTSILNREGPTERAQVNFAETVDPPYNAPSTMTTASILANGRKPRSVGTLVAPPKYGVNIQQPPLRRIIPQPPSHLTNKDSSPVAHPAPPTVVRWFAADSVDYPDVKPSKPLSPITETSTPPLTADSTNIPQNDSGQSISQSNDSGQEQVVAPLPIHRKSLTDRTFQEASDVILNSLTPASTLSSNYVIPTSPTTSTNKPDLRILGANSKNTTVKFDTGNYPPFYSDKTDNNFAQNKSTGKESIKIVTSDVKKSLRHGGYAGHPRLSTDADDLSVLGFSSATLPRESHFRHYDINTLPMDKSMKSTSVRDDLSHDDGNSSSRPDSNFTSVETVVAAGSLARLRSLAQDPARSPPQRSPQTVSSSARHDKVEKNFTITTPPMHNLSQKEFTRTLATSPGSHSEHRRPLQRQNRLPDSSMDFREDVGRRHPKPSVLISTPAEVQHLATPTAQSKNTPDTARSTIDNIRATPPSSSQHSLSRSVTRTFGAASVTVTPLEKHSDGDDTWRRNSGHRGNEASHSDVIEGTINLHTSRPDPVRYMYDGRMRSSHESEHLRGPRYDRMLDDTSATVRPRRGGEGASIPVDSDMVTWDREQFKGREDLDSAAQRRYERQQFCYDEGSRIPTHQTDSLLSGDIDSSAMMLDERTRMCGEENAENLSNIVNAFEDTTSKATVYDNVQYFRM